MKITTSLLNYFRISLIACAVLVFVGCSDDEGPNIIDTGGIEVGDGLYLAIEGEDPSASAGLSDEMVEGESFTSQERTGFVGGYMYLEAGNYNVVQVTAKEVTTTIGGTVTSVTDEGSKCDYNDYTVVTTAVDGPAISLGSSGFYRVTHDQMTSELIIYKIEFPGLIGAATPGAWDTDTQMTGSVDATGGSWSAADVVLRNGEWKLRFNCRWSIDRRVDPSGNFDSSNGYQMFTNFGGSASNLMNGNDGGNAENEVEGIYTATVNWSPSSGFSLTLDRTGDAPVLTFDPNDFNWGIIGDATANGWDADRNMYYKVDGDLHKWYGVVALSETGEFKFRINDAWAYDIGGILPADGSMNTLPSQGDEEVNIPSPGAGSYYIVLSTADEGDTWQASMVNIGWSVIGEGSPSGDWDNDTDLTSMGFVDGVSSFTYQGAFTTGEWKFRAGHDWNLALGGSLATLTREGGNISLSADGTYLVTLTYDGENFSATAELQ